MAEVVRHFEITANPNDALRSAGWRVIERDGGLEATQGSQWRTRLLGGWFVKGEALPKRLKASLSMSGRYEITASSTFGFGYIDPRFRRRYEEAFDDLERRLER